MATDRVERIEQSCNGKSYKYPQRGFDNKTPAWEDKTAHFRTVAAANAKVVDYMIGYAKRIKCLPQQAEKIIVNELMTSNALNEFHACSARDGILEVALNFEGEKPGVEWEIEFEINIDYGSEVSGQDSKNRVNNARRSPSPASKKNRSPSPASKKNRLPSPDSKQEQGKEPHIGFEITTKNLDFAKPDKPITHVGHAFVPSVPIGRPKFSSKKLVPYETPESKKTTFTEGDNAGLTITPKTIVRYFDDETWEQLNKPTEK